MLIPRFEITQTDTEVAIIVHAPYINIKDAKIYVDGTKFAFNCTPYFLRLQLPGEIEANDSLSYDWKKGDFAFRYSKVNKGEHFENLDMITTLLAPPKKKSTVIPNIEVIGNPSANANIDDSLNDNDITNNDADNKCISQNIPSENVTDLIDSPKYGFANKISGFLAAYEASLIKEIIDLPSPNTTPEAERKSLQEKRELEDFEKEEEHYMIDLMEPECIESCIAYTPEWDMLQKDKVTFSETEIDLLKDLSNKEYLLDDEDIKKLCLNLIDILYASCYNHRTTLGENTVESSWTINKLSSTLCWLRNFISMDEVIIACFRRSLCYPHYRNWELSMKVFEDVKKILTLGKKYIIKVFCEIHNLFNNSPCAPRYLLNQLYIKDFLIWLQASPESLIEPLHSILNNIHPSKESMGLDLIELEVAVYSTQEEGLVIENAVHEMAGQIDELCLNDSEKEKPKNIYHVNKQFFKHLLLNNTSSMNSSDTDSETDSESSTTSSSTTTSSSSSLDSDDLSEPE